MPNSAPETRPALIANLYPTQFTLGLREVANKRLRWRSRLSRAGSPGVSVIAPVVKGRNGRLYLIDRHHLLRALQLERVEEVLVRRIADFSEISAQQFWKTLEANGWCRPYDGAGRRISFEEMPCSIDGLVDDPYRSLASALRRRGGFTKTPRPFSEFAWADYLRTRINCELLAKDFEAALSLALAQAKAPAAQGLPGWRPGPHDRWSIGAVMPSPHASR